MPQSPSPALTAALSAITGALSMAFGASLRAPHGGIWVLPLMGNIIGFVIALAVGVVVMAGLVIVLKGSNRANPAAVTA